MIVAQFQIQPRLFLGQLSTLSLTYIVWVAHLRHQNHSELQAMNLCQTLAQIYLFYYEINPGLCIVRTAIPFGQTSFLSQDYGQVLYGTNKKIISSSSLVHFQNPMIIHGQYKTEQSTDALVEVE